jgi:putative nucleotidyltransferase with HDIG domain
MLPTGLTVVVDRNRRPLLPEALTVSAAVIDSQDVAALSAIPDGAILLDVDLADLQQVKLLKNKLPARNGDHIRIVVVERASHWCEIQANGLGASDLLKRPWDMTDLRKCLRRYGNERVKEEAADPSSIEQMPGGAAIACAARELDRLFSGLSANATLDFGSLERAGDEVVQAVADVGLAKWLEVVRHYHKGTFQHCLLVTGVVSTFGHKTGMRKKHVLTLTVGGLLHDIGKAEVPTEILDKPGKLTDAEFAQIKKHPVAGYEYLRRQGSLDSETLAAVRHHHEYLDGSGYPDGIVASEIGDLTRIMTICDVYGALVEQRAYKPPRSPAVAMEILVDMAKKGKVEYQLVKALGSCISS